mmetsp:Transcript_67447/g.191436  ORF Transcript_67447/g.191436 Transcript_67447/m.191436 type:complete len:456 (-) Transcript_67447:433-1800(-)
MFTPLLRQSPPLFLERHIRDVLQPPGLHRPASGTQLLVLRIPVLHLLLVLLDALLADRRLPAPEPGALVLEVVEGHLRGVIAGGSVAPVVRQHPEVLHAPDPQVVHAVRHEEVLAPALPVHVVHAAVLVVAVGDDGVLGEDFEGAEELGGLVVVRTEPPVAVHEVDGVLILLGVPHVLLQVGPKALWEEHRVGIDLHGPAVLLVPAVLGDHCPGVQEGLHVCPGRSHVLVGAATLAPAGGRAAENHVVVAGEDAARVLPSLVQDVRLAGHRDLEAEQGRGPDGRGLRHGHLGLRRLLLADHGVHGQTEGSTHRVPLVRPGRAVNVAHLDQVCNATTEHALRTVLSSVAAGILHTEAALARSSRQLHTVLNRYVLLLGFKATGSVVRTARLVQRNQLLGAAMHRAIGRRRFCLPRHCGLRFNIRSVIRRADHLHVHEVVISVRAFGALGIAPAVPV